MDDRLVEEQIEYYRRRAPEYDATSSPPGSPHAPFLAEIERVLDEYAPRGDVLEIASGTGTWTKQLLRHADRVTALDAAPEMHEESRRKLGDDERVRYVLADALAWEPDRSYDVVFFANWLSHVPPERFEGFWELVDRALAPGGRVFVVDEGADARHQWHFQEDFVMGEGVPIVRRSLSDGSTHRLIKVFREPAELEAELRRQGWDVRARPSGPFFWAAGRRAAAT